jgi:glutathione S-transferase
VFNQLPSITLPSGKVVSQSGAIIRYAGRLANLAPADEELLLDADMIVELANEMNAINPMLVFYQKDSEKFNEQKGQFGTQLPAWLASATRVLAAKDYFGGSSPSYGDFALLPIIDNTLKIFPDALEASPALQAWYERVIALPTVNAYLSAREPLGVPGSFISTL